MLNRNNNKIYTLKFLGEKIKQKQYDSIKSNKNLNNINHKNYSPLNDLKNLCNKSSSYLNKEKIVLKKEKNKNRSTKTNNNNMKINIIEKGKDKNNINEYKINNASSSYNNNFTDIKAEKILFIDLNNENKNNNNNNKKQNIENLSNNKFKINDRYIENINIKLNKEKVNNKVILKSNNNKELNHNNPKNPKTNNNNSTFDNNQLNRKNKTTYNNNINIKFSNLTIQNLNNQKNELNNYTIFVDKIEHKKDAKQKEIKEFKKEKNLSTKEYAFYILTKSPILRLCERMIFARSTKNLRNIVSKENIFEENKTILENKLSELKDKIVLCNNILNTPFSASKTADITLNFTTSFHELEFKDYSLVNAKEKEKKYYINYIKMLYYLLNGDFKNQENSILLLRTNLYSLINQRGYNCIRDFLYDVYIKKKEQIKEIPNINEINNLMNQDKELYDNNNNSFHVCKFISFTMYLIKEIIKFGNNINSIIELKIKSTNLFEIIVIKLGKYKTKIENK